MGYDLKKIDSIKAIQIPSRIKQDNVKKYRITEDDYNKFVRFKKADAQIRIFITLGNILKIENISIKKAILLI